MKRIFTTLITLAAFVFSAAAQTSTPNYDNFFSMRAGVNFASLISNDYETDAQTGFNVAALYNISLTDTAPIYLQSGVSVEMKGARNSGLIATNSPSHFKSYAIEIPVVVTFEVMINQSMSIVPELGLFYSYAFTGSLSGGDEFYRPYKKLDIESLNGEMLYTELFHRSDFGIRAGLAFQFMSCSIGVAYDAGLVNHFSKKLRDDGASCMTGCWSLNLGCKFNTAHK